MDKNIQEIIKKAKKDKKVLAVALFGSYARGEQYNDIDICIFLNPKEYSAKELSTIKLKYTLENEKYDTQLFQQLPLYIRKRILKEGKIIYCKNEDFLYDTYFDTLRDYSHFERIYKEYLEAVESG